MEKKDILHKFIECYVPVTACNFRCHYCYIAQLNDQNNGKLPTFEYSPEQVACVFARERLGGTCLVNLCGAGETLLPKEMPAYIKAILSEGHFVMVVTNMVLEKRLDAILAAPPEHLERLFFKCSFHYLELKRLNLLERFCDNIEKVRAAGCSTSVEITPSDELMPHIDEICRFSLERFGALPHVTVGRDETQKNSVRLPRLTKLSREEYEKVWSRFDSPLFEFKSSIWEKKVGDFCYAGKWSLVLNLRTGKTGQCYSSGRLTDFYTGAFVKKPVCHNCREPHCYNGHAFITLGLVPSIPSPTYAEMRDRKCLDGSHWLTPRMRAFFNQKLYENNREYTDEEKEKLSKDNKESFIERIRHRVRGAVLRIKRLRKRIKSTP